jgi:hypothetical protein
MAVKRKHSTEPEDSFPNIKTKQLKLIPFPNQVPDMDVAMSDAEPITIPSNQYHIRLPSDASSLSSASDSSEDSPAYPSFDLCPHPFFDNSGTVNPDSHVYALYAAQPTLHPDGAWAPSHTAPENTHSENVGLLQPSSAFVHHSSNCSQIPKLRIACSPGMNGQRTMWSYCEQCGAISMVDSD